MPMLAAGWVLVLAAILLGARVIWPEGRDSERAKVAEVGDGMGTENALLLETAVPLCSKVLSGFLGAGTPEERNQFVLDSLNTAAKMARFYNLNPLASLDATQMGLDGYGVIGFPSGKGVTTRWQHEDGRIFEVLFREEQGEWKLDWEHFVRYGEYPWGLFLAGSGPEQGDFRLFARERLAQERRGADTISVVLYAPRFGHPESAIAQSPEIVVPRASEEGRLLDAAFHAAREGKAVFGDPLKPLDPDDLIRVRVRVERVENENERRFEIRRVEACHWYSDEAPGVAVERRDTFEGALEDMEKESGTEPVAPSQEGSGDAAAPR